MKRIARAIAASLLALVAHLIVRKYHPKIVMVTGSVGKTSTKDALAATLSPRYFLRASEKSYNSEFGVPFTVLGVRNPWKNPVRWLWIAKEALALIFLPNHYPSLLILEVGADRPGDIARILEIASPDAVVVTRLPEVPVHVEAYASPAAVREEEFMPAFALPPGAPLIIASDDVHARELSARVSARLVTYGFGDADVALSDPDFAVEKGRAYGMRATVKVKGETKELVVRGSLGYQQLLPAAAALATAEALGIDPKEALEALREYVPPPGRGRLLKGIHGSVLIDDTYNSSPIAALEALQTLADYPMARGGGRRVAVLGDMLELGRYSVAEHERIGRRAKNVADLVVTVGIRARSMGGAQSFDDAYTAATYLRNEVRAGDIVLIKGSQSVRLERITEALLADASSATQLVRQEREWRAR